MGAAPGPVDGGASATAWSADRSAVTLTLAGRLDAVRAPALRAGFDQVVADGAEQVVVDLSAVEFVDSAALAALVRLRRRCTAAGATLTLVRPESEEALRIFQLTQFDRVFTMVGPMGRR
jgi:anti-sigma B factor antagonist